MKSTLRAFDFAFIAFIAVLTSSASIACELLIARFLSSLSQDSVLSQSITIGVYLAGLGLGSYAAGFFTKEKVEARLIWIECLLSILIALSLFFILWLHLSISGWVLPAGISKIKVLIFISQVPVMGLGFLAGFEIPLLLALAKNEERAFGRIIGIGYIGGLLGTLGLSFALIPRFGLMGSALVLSMVSAAAAVFIYLRYFFSRPHLSFILILFSLALPVGLSKISPQIQQFYLKSYYYVAPVNWNYEEIKNLLKLHQTLPEIRRISSRYQEIDIVQDEYHGDVNWDQFHLFLDHRLQFGSNNEKIYHDLMIHASLNLAGKKPKQVLIVGGGDALLVRELLKYPELESVTLVELDPAIIDLAKSDPAFIKLSENALLDPRVKIVLADGFDWIRKSRDQFDSIFVDLPHPHSFEISRLYSTEFYRFLRGRLTQNGFLVFDFPFFSLMKQKEENPAGLNQAASVLKSVESAGFKDYRVFGSFESFVICFQEKANYQFDYEKLSPLVSSISVPQLSLLKTDDFQNLKVSENSIFRPQWLKSGFDGN